MDWLQLDEPYLQARPEQARAYGVTAINAALAGLHKPTCIHLCFGYAYTHALAGSTKSGGYEFLTELERSTATQISIETAQPKLDLSVLAGLPSKSIVLGVLDLGDPAPRHRTRSPGGWRPGSSTCRSRASSPRPTAA